MPVPYTYYVHVDADHAGTLAVLNSVAWPGTFALVFGQGRDIHLRLDNLSGQEVLDFAIDLWNDARLMAHKQPQLVRPFKTFEQFMEQKIAERQKAKQPKTKPSLMAETVKKRQSKNTRSTKT
jgi:hypothetical protein